MEETFQARHGGPRRWKDKTAQHIIDRIVTFKSAPTYYNIKKAWVVLGYAIRPCAKPSEPNLCLQVRDLWKFLARVQTVKANRARAYILDALRTLGFRNPRWHVNLRQLDVTVEDRHGQRLTNQMLWWHHVPGPPAGGNNGPSDPRVYYQTDFKEPQPTDNEKDHRRKHETDMWRKFHRYQGFSAEDRDPDHNLWHFRAVPVPEGPDSLWHCVSYWVYERDRQNARFGDIWKHWLVKAQIWSFFMQVLKDSNHPRWADYHLFQADTQKRVDLNFGELGLARSLHASRTQGTAALSDHRIFWVIADYFSTQVIVFYPDDSVDPDKHPFDRPMGENDVLGPPVPYEDADSVESVMEITYGQYDKSYFYRVYGYQRSGEHPQILLVTSDWKNYDIAEYDHSTIHTPPPPNQQPGRSPSDWDYRGARRFNRQYPYFNAGGGPPPHPWWPNGNNPGAPNRQLHLTENGRPPYKQAKYNFLTPDELQTLRQHFPGPNPTIPAAHPHPTTFKYAPADIIGPLPSDTNPLHLTGITAECFEAGLDIPGTMFWLPPAAQLVSWRTEHHFRHHIPTREAARYPDDSAGVECATWRFGRDPMGLEEVRVWDRRWERLRPEVGRGVVIEGGRQMMDDPMFVFRGDWGAFGYRGV